MNTRNYSTTNSGMHLDEQVKRKLIVRIDKVLLFKLAPHSDMEESEIRGPFKSGREVIEHVKKLIK